MSTAPLSHAQRVAMLGLVLMVFTAAALASEPVVAGFRGDTSGRFPDQRPPTSWDHETGANILWRADQHTPSSSTPAVAGGRVFTLAEPDKLLCYDAVTGEELWRRCVDVTALTGDTAARAAFDDYEEKMHRIHIKGERIKGWKPKKAFPRRWRYPKPTSWAVLSYTTASPVATDEVVVAKIGTGIVAAYDHDGKQLWAERYAVRHLHGAVPTPLIVGDRVFIIENRRDKGRDAKDWQYFSARDLQTGRQLWVSEPFTPSHDYCASPAPMQVDGRTYLVHIGGAVVDAETGKTVVENFSFGGDGSSPVVSGDTVWMFTSRLGKDSFANDGPPGTHVQAWRFAPGTAGLTHEKIFDMQVSEKRSRSHGSPVVAGDRAWFPMQKGRLIAADPTTGSVTEKQVRDLGTKNMVKKGERTGYWYNSPMIAGGNIYVMAPNGQVAVFTASATPRLVGEGRLPRNLTVGNIVCADDRLYIRSFKTLWCIGRK